MAAARQRFFAGLPADELTPVEHSLRKALLKALGSNSGKFPLIEWIDRRIGGEIETRRDENGFYEILQRGSAPPDSNNNHRGGGEISKDAFFSSLAPDAFAPPEEALREAVFEFLASWRSPELATLQQLSAYPAVQKRRGEFLPRSVSLREWIEHRIGGEIEFRRGARPGEEAIHLTESARSTVVAKFQQMSMGPCPGPPPMGPCPGPPLMGPCPGPPPMGPFMGPPPMMPQGGMGMPPPMDMGAGQGNDKEAWFANLPTDELLPAELALREAVISWIRRWPECRPSHRSAGSSPQLSDTGQDNEIRRCRAELLPSKIRLAEWIERRIGGEVELKSIGNGQHEVFLRGSAPPETRTRSGASSGKRSRSGGGSGGASQEEKEDFFASLPGDEFSPGEESLRAALLYFLDRWTSSSPPSGDDCSNQEEISKARRMVLPRGCPVSLKEWIDRRIGGEIETRAGSSGSWIFGIRGKLPSATGSTGSAKRRRT